MAAVSFYDTTSDDRLRFAVVIAKYNGFWVFCKHKARRTYELPGGRREAGEKSCKESHFPSSFVIHM